jgi:hypothetical protein
MRRIGVAVMALAAVALLAGCGGGSSGNYSTPKATVETMIAAAKAGNKDGMMGCFTDDARRKLTEIERLSEQVAKDVPQLAKVMNQKKDEGVRQMMEETKKAKFEFGQEKIEGSKATLEVTSNGRKETMNFVKESSGWKLDMGISDEQFEMMKKGIEMMKSMPKGLIEEGVKKGLEGLK